MDNPTSTELEVEQSVMMKMIDDCFVEYQSALDNGDYDTEKESQIDQKMLETDKQKWIDYKAQVEKLDKFIKTDKAQADILLQGSLAKTLDEVHKAMNIDCEDCINGLVDAVNV